MVRRKSLGVMRNSNHGAERILIAIATCHRFRARADAQRATWVSRVRGADVRFFLGHNGVDLDGVHGLDEVLLDVQDDYFSLPYKVRAIFRWALEHDYDYVFKADDDIYVEPDRLLASDFRYDYAGRPTTGPVEAPRPIPYASGFLYSVSRKAMTLLAEADINDWAEDRWVGATLLRARVPCHRANGYAILYTMDPRIVVSETEGPRATNSVIAACELSPQRMEAAHRAWLGAADGDSAANRTEPAMRYRSRATGEAVEAEE